jgi:outer membrane autotransporter protein
MHNNKGNFYKIVLVLWKQKRVKQLFMLSFASIGVIFARKSISARFSSHLGPGTAAGGHSKVQKAGDGASMALLLSFGLLTLFSLETEAQDIDLGGAQNVTVLGGSTVTNTGATTVTGNLAVAPGTAVTGFPPGVVVGGAIHNNDALAQTAHADTLTAYNTLAGEVSPPSKNLTGTDLGGLTLTPGVYKFNTSAQLTGTLTLNTLGNPDAVFHFQIGTTLTTASASLVDLIGSSDPNIFWQVGSSATLGSGTVFQGNILALASITMVSGASLSNGRALAINGAVTMDTNQMNGPAAILPSSIWNGSLSNRWSGLNNWSPTLAGDTTGPLVEEANVVFSVTGIAPKNENTILDANFTIASLTVNDPVPVSITGPFTLTINGLTGTTVNLGAGLVTINSALALSGLSQLITVNNTAGLVINGTVASTAGLIKLGTGVLTLTAAEPYTGPTLVSVGTLQLGDGTIPGTSISSSSSVTVNPGGTLAINLASTETFGNAVTNNGQLAAIAAGTNTISGAITGTGTVLQDGTGTTILSGTNTYSGGTFFNAGTLAIANDGNLGTGPLTFNGGTLEALGPGVAPLVSKFATLATLAAGGGIVSAKPVTLNNGGGTFLADPGTSSTLSGVISGPGALTKAGDGELVLAGASTYSGGTNLDAGTLTVNSARALGAGNLTVNAGILRTEAQPINVTGNYVQTGGTLQLNVAGGNPGQYDTVNVGGNASLGGTLQLLAGGFVPKSGSLLTLITTGGVVSGQFTQFIDPFAQSPGITTVDLLYNNQSVQVLFIGTTPVPGFGPDSSINAIFQADTVEALTAFYEISFSNANIQRLTLEDRLDDIRNGSSGFSSNMKVNGAQTEHDGKASLDGKSAKAPVEQVLQSRPENRWGVWVTGFGDFVSVDSEANAHGYNFTTGGVSLGIDFRLTDFLAIGAMGEYSHTWTSLDPSGHLDVDSGRGGMYATLFGNGFYLNSGIYGGHNNYDTGRSSFLGMANGSTEGEEWSAFASGGYDFHLGHLGVGPIASLQYTDVHIDGFNENGSSAPLAVHAGTEESLRSDIGFRVFYAWQIGNLVLQPSLKAAWEHEYKYSALPITAGFADVPGPSATFFGPSEGHDSAVVSAGLSVRFSNTISTYVYYDGQLGRSNYDSNAVTGGVRISF